VLERWAAWPRGTRWLVGGIAVVVLALIIVWVLFVPAADWLARHDVGSAKGSVHETAVDNARGRLLTLGAGLFAAGALVFTARNFTLSREGQVTDRYTKAIGQLGSDKLDVRIGGIYALERIARDSKRDHPTVMEALTAFIREHSHEQWPVPDPGTHLAPPRTTRPDVQAALTVVGNRDPKRDIRRVDLSRADLSGANLAGARLGGLIFGRFLVNSSGADLSGATLSGGTLRFAHLIGADLTGTDLTGADLTGADLRETDLTGAHLTRAHLYGAVLRGADLTGADLTRVDLTRVDLTSARWPAAGAHSPSCRRPSGSGCTAARDHAGPAGRTGNSACRTYATPHSAPRGGSHRPGRGRHTARRAGPPAQPGQGRHRAPESAPPNLSLDLTQISGAYRHDQASLHSCLTPATRGCRTGM
jgi:Pentapeptide repeats (8 copies)